MHARCLRRPKGAGVADGYDTVIMWGLGLEPGTLEEPVLFIAEPGLQTLLQTATFQLLDITS